MFWQYLRYAPTRLGLESIVFEKPVFGALGIAQFVATPAERIKVGMYVQA